MVKGSALFATLVAAASAATPEWTFIQNGTSGILALEAMIVSPTLAIMFDRAANDPLMIDGHPAWGALWNLETNTATPLRVVSDTFCASGAFLSNGTMVSVGGMVAENPDIDPDIDGRMGIRIFEPCTDPAGVGCTLFDDPATLHMVETRWYPTSLRMFDGSLMIVGGIHERTPFYNTDPVNNFEFFPPKDNGVPRPSEFLNRSLPANLFPRAFQLPDGKFFMVANNQSIIYDFETNTEHILPDVPNGVRVTNPFDGTATLLPLVPPLYTPEILVCGGTNTSDLIQPANLSSQDPASDQCSRLTLTTEGIKKGWEVERMLEGRMMPEFILMPNGEVLIINGAQTGYAAFNTVPDPVGNQSNADHPAFTPSIYSPNAPLGQRISNKGMPATDIARVYHSTVTLTPQGNILLAGSNPNALVTEGVEFHTEFRVETLNPPFMFMARPKLLSVPTHLGFNQQMTIPVSIPASIKGSTFQVALMDLGFSSHAFHSSSRLVFLVATLSKDKKELTIVGPPNNRIFPPGPGWLFLTVDDVTSVAAQVMVGSGAPPPQADSGLRLPHLDLVL